MYHGPLLAQHKSSRNTTYGAKYLQIDNLNIMQAIMLKYQRIISYSFIIYITGYIITFQYLYDKIGHFKSTFLAA